MMSVGSAPLGLTGLYLSGCTGTHSAQWWRCFPMKGVGSVLWEMSTEPPARVAVPKRGLESELEGLSPPSGGLGAGR